MNGEDTASLGLGADFDGVAGGVIAAVHISGERSGKAELNALPNARGVVDVVMADIEAGHVAALNHGVQHMRVDGAGGKAFLVHALEVDLWVVLMGVDILKFGEADMSEHGAGNFGSVIVFHDHGLGVIPKLLIVFDKVIFAAGIIACVIALFDELGVFIIIVKTVGVEVLIIVAGVDCPNVKGNGGLVVGENGENIVADTENSVGACGGNAMGIAFVNLLLTPFSHVGANRVEITHVVVVVAVGYGPGNSVGLKASNHFVDISDKVLFLFKGAGPDVVAGDDNEVGVGLVDHGVKALYRAVLYNLAGGAIVLEVGNLKYLKAAVLVALRLRASLATASSAGKALILDTER